MHHSDSTRRSLVAASGGRRVFGRLKSMLKMSEAGVIVKEALKSLPVPALPFDADSIATRLVAISYDTKPDLFDGKLGTRPHPIATAAVSLAGGLSYDGFEHPRTARRCVFLALGSVLQDVSGNGARYGLGPLDLRLLEMAETAYLAFGKTWESPATPA